MQQYSKGARNAPLRTSHLRSPNAKGATETGRGWTRRWVPIWVVPLIILMAIGTVWTRLYVVRTTYAINQAEKNIRNTNLTRERAELKVTGLKSPRRLELLARTRFGLAQPKTDQVVYPK